MADRPIPYEPTYRLLTGDCLEQLRTMEADSVQCVVTSPPYWGLRDYGVPGQIGLERTPDEYVQRMVEVFREVRRVLRPDGTCWLNLGDCYATGAGKVGDAPGGGAQGARWRGDVDRIRDHKRGYRRDRVANHYANAVGPLTQPTRMPIPGLKPKDLVGIPWRVAFALQADGWWLRADIIWSKPNPMPESVRDRPTKSHEYLFLLTKAESYYYDRDAIAEPLLHPADSTSADMARAFSRRRATIPNPRQDSVRVEGDTRITLRNRRSVWTIATTPCPEAHFAAFPKEIPRICILAGTRRGDVVLDPFSGAGTTGVVALELGRSYVGCEIHPEYVEMSRRRLSGVAPLFAREGPRDTGLRTGEALELQEVRHG